MLRPCVSLSLLNQPVILPWSPRCPAAAMRAGSTSASSTCTPLLMLSSRSLPSPSSLESRCGIGVIIALRQSSQTLALLGIDGTVPWDGMREQVFRALTLSETSACTSASSLALGSCLWQRRALSPVNGCGCLSLCCNVLPQTQCKLESD